MKRDERFDAVLESEAEPPRAEFGRTLPFTKARVALEDIYRLSQDAEKPANMLLTAARSGPDELAAALRALDGKPWRGFALLYAAQKANALVAADPGKSLTLARAVYAESATLVEANRDARATTPAPRQAVQAEARLLEGQSLLAMGETEGAEKAIALARPLFAESSDLGFGSALCDYHEGEAANFGRDYVRAERLIRNAVRTFEEFGQDHLLAKGEAAIATILGNRGDHAAALPFFDHAIALFDSATDGRALTASLSNRANSLAQLSRFDEARASYAKAMTLALRNGATAQLRVIRTGLAELDFLRGQYARALRAFREIAADALENGSSADVLFARLYVSECLGRTAQYDAMAREIESIREARRKSPFAPSAALGELFMCLDQGTLDADLVAHVRGYLEAVEDGADRPYMPLRLVG